MRGPSQLGSQQHFTWIGAKMGSLRHLSQALKSTVTVLIGVLIWSNVSFADFALQYQIAGTGRDSLVPGTVAVRLSDTAIEAQRVRSGPNDSITVALQNADLKAVAPSQLAISEDRVSATLTPAGTSRIILGHRCSGYDLSVYIYSENFSARAPDASVKGQVWIAADVPGKAAWSEAILTLTSAGATVSSAEGTTREPERARALMLAIRTMMDAGTPLEGNLQVEQAGRALGSRIAATLSENIRFKATRATADSDSL